MIARFARILDRLSLALSHAALVLACAGVALLVVTMMVQVVARYMLSSPLAWTEELARYAMVWAGLLGATAAYQRRADPVLLSRGSLPAMLRRPAEWLELVAVIAFALSVLVYTPQLIVTAATRTSETMQVPMAWVMAIVPICFGLLLLHALARAAMLATGQYVDAPADVEAGTV